MQVGTERSRMRDSPNSCWSSRSSPLREYFGMNIWRPGQEPEKMSRPWSRKRSSICWPGRPEARPRAMSPPADVPAMRSRWLARRSPRISSVPARKAAVKTPRMPPPSRQRTRKGRLPTSATLRGAERQRDVRALVGGEDVRDGHLARRLVPAAHLPLHREPLDIGEAGNVLDGAAPHEDVPG